MDFTGTELLQQQIMLPLVNLSMSRVPFHYHVNSLCRFIQWHLTMSCDGFRVQCNLACCHFFSLLHQRFNTLQRYLSALRGYIYSDVTNITTCGSFNVVHGKFTCSWPGMVYRYCWVSRCSLSIHQESTLPQACWNLSLRCHEFIKRLHKDMGMGSLKCVAKQAIFLCIKVEFGSLLQRVCRVPSI